MAGNLHKLLWISAATLALTACGARFDADLRSWGDGFDTSDAARQATERPRPDSRGVISYPNYQVVVAKRGETVTQIAGRLGQSADQISRFNGLEPDGALRAGEIIALPDRVTEPSPATGAVGTGPVQPIESVNVTTLAAAAIDAAETEVSGTAPTQTATQRRAELPQTGREPIRHKVARGETAYSISRLYQVSVRSLADWNGLGADRQIREGQFLLIPVTNQAPPAATVATTNPGAGSPTPTPPSASQPLPPATTTTTTTQTLPTTPAIGQSTQTASTNARMIMPVQGPIIRAFKKGRSEGIDIGTSAGAPVVAAASGTVAAITENTDKVPILVIQHPNNVLTVYASIEGIKVTKGMSVQKGQPIAIARSGDPSFVHFEVREGFDAVDPADYLN